MKAAMKWAMRNGSARGFTLIELMITVAILGILISVALPSYLDSVRKGRRADAQSVLLEASHFMERFATENLRFDQSRADGAVALPATLSSAPKHGATKFYTISLQAVGQSSFTLRAVPQGAMAGDTCGTMTLTDTGVKGATLNTCWGR